MAPSEPEAPTDTSSLSLKIFYPDAVHDAELDEYNRAFAFWYEIWLETRREVDGSLATPSDSFARQSEILVLYDQARPIATCCHRYVDLRHQCVLYDSYFTSTIWPAAVRELVPTLGESCLLGSHIFIHPDYRRCKTALPIKAIICSLSMAHINGTRPDVLLGAARIDKGISKLWHEGGAVSLDAGASWYHIPVDLIALYPKRTPITVPAGFQEIVRTVGKTCERFTQNYFERKSSIANH